MILLVLIFIVAIYIYMALTPHYWPLISSSQTMIIATPPVDATIKQTAAGMAS